MGLQIWLGKPQKSVSTTPPFALTYPLFCVFHALQAPFAWQQLWPTHDCVSM